MTKFEFQTGDKVLARDFDHNNWTFSHFSHVDGKNYICDGWSYRQCIPYNETTKHLCGTSDPYIDPAEAPAFEFGDVVSFWFNGEERVGIITKISFNTVHRKTVFSAVTKNGFEWNHFAEQFCLIRKGNFND